MSPEPHKNNGSKDSTHNGLPIPPEILILIQKASDTNSLEALIKSHKIAHDVFVSNYTEICRKMMVEKLKDEDMCRYFPKTYTQPESQPPITATLVRASSSGGNESQSDKELKKAYNHFNYTKQVFELDSIISKLSEWVSSEKGESNQIFPRPPAAWARKPSLHNHQGGHQITLDQEYHSEERKLFKMHFICMAQDHFYLREKSQFDDLNGRSLKFGPEIAVTNTVLNEFNLHPYRFNRMTLQLPNASVDTSLFHKLVRSIQNPVNEDAILHENTQLTDREESDFLIRMYQALNERSYTLLNNKNLLVATCAYLKKDPVWFRKSVSRWEPGARIQQFEHFMLLSMPPKLLHDCIKINVADMDVVGFINIRKKVFAHLRQWSVIDIPECKSCTEAGRAQCY